MTTLLEMPLEESLADQIYRGIRSRIINGELEQGSRLRERDLATELGVSRIPLREAFPRLERDGFIVSLPRRSSRVTSLTLNDIDELFEARIGIEVYATRLATERVAAGASIAPLESALARAEIAYRTMGADGIVEANAAVHDAVVELSSNSLLVKMMESIAGRYRWIFRLTFTQQVAGSGEEHAGIYDAIRSGDVDRAAEMALKHIIDGREPTLRRFRGLLPQQ